MRKFSILNFQFSITLLTICFLLVALPVLAETSEERAVNNVSVENAVFGAQPTEPSGNILQNILNALGELKDRLLFFRAPTKPAKVFGQSEFLQQINVPGEVLSNEGSFKEQLQDDLGGQTGFYGLSIPDEVSKEAVPDSECLYEQSRFPAGVDPVTEGAPCK